jgi:hypothetical protein
MGGDVGTKTLSVVKSSTEDSFVGNTRFELVRRLGQGGMGVVFEAVDRELGTRVALKTMQNVSGESLLFFKNEFRALQHIHHPNLIRLGELLVDGKNLFFTMELVEGVELLRYVRPQDRTSNSDLATNVAATESLGVFEHDEARPLFDEKRIRSTFGQLGSALMAMHAAGKIHRDIKSSNILVTDDERVVLLDLGLVTGVHSVSIEGPGRVVGTAQYMAPEQLRGEEVGPPADWYSFGVLLYFALTGRRPFATDKGLMLTQKLERDVLPPSGRVDQVPEDLEALCLEALCLDLLRAKPYERPAGLSVVERLQGSATRGTQTSAAHETNFVGRSIELAILDSAYTEARRGRPVTVMVEGESGVGKSALVQHFLDARLPSGAGVVLRGRCYERESVSYKAVDEVMDALSLWLKESGSKVTQALPENVHLVPEAFPAMTNVPAIAAACHRAPVAALKSRLAVFAAVRSLFAKVAELGPMVMWIDDLQWSDQDSLALLAAVLQSDSSEQPLPLLLLATIRSEAALLSKVANLPGTVHRCTVGGLSKDDTRLLATKLTVGQAQSVDIDRVLLEANGHPLFLDALLRHRKTHGETRGIRLDDALVARVDAMSTEAREIFDVVVVAGGPLPQGVVAEVLGKTFADLAKPLAELRGAQLVRTGGPHRGDVVEPFHDRVPESSLARFAAGQLKEWHVRLAQVLEHSPLADLEQLAFHWREAGEHASALKYATRAAVEAVGSMAFDRAARLYRMAVGMASEPIQRRELLVALGEVLTFSGRGIEAAEVRLEAAAGAEPKDAHKLRRTAMENLVQSGSWDRGIAAIRQLLADEGISFSLSSFRSFPSMILHRARLALRGLKYKVVEEAKIDGGSLRRLDTLWSVSMALGFIDTIAAADFQSRGLYLALELGEPGRLALNFGAEAMFYQTAGHHARHRANLLFQRADELGSQLNDPRVQVLFLSARVVGNFLVGDFRAGADALERVELMHDERRVGAEWNHSVVQLFGLWCQWYLGDIPAFSKRFVALLRQADERNDVSLSTNLRSSFTNVYWLLRGEVAEAKRSAERARSTFYPGVMMRHFDDLLCQANINLYEGDGEAALARFAEANWALKKSLTFSVQSARIALIDLRARAALVAAVSGRSHHHKMLASAKRDAKKIDAEKTPWASPLAALRHAGVAASLGDYTRAGGRLVAAIRGFEACDMKLHALLAKVRLAQLCGDVDQYVQQLTASGIAEPHRILQMLAPGFDSLGRLGAA